MIAALVIAGALIAPQAAQRPAVEIQRGTIERWRGAIELDLPREVLAEGQVLVAPGGELATAGEAVALVARALFDAGEEGEAQALLDGAKPAEATRAFVELERARQWIERDELARAVAFFLPDVAPARLAEALRKAPAPRLAAFPESHFLLGRALSRLGQARGAVPYLEYFAQHSPRHEWASTAWHMLAQEAFSRGDAPRGAELAKRAEAAGRWRAFYKVRRLQIREQPSEPLPRLGLAQLWMEAGELARAKAALDELVALAPDFAAGWFHLGECERKLAEARNDPEAFAPAEKAYSRALELDPEQHLARYNRAVIAMLRGGDAQARADFEALCAGPRAADPVLIGAHLALARLHLRAGDEPAAQARYARYVELGGKEPLKK